MNMLSLTLISKHWYFLRRCKSNSK